MALLLTATTPADDAINISPIANLFFTFDAAVKAGSGNVEIRRTSDDSIAMSIAITDASQVGFSGNQLIINPTGTLAQQTGYYVLLAPGAVLDLADNPFAGISSPSTFNFTTRETTPPQLTGMSPGLFEVGVNVGSNIVVTFDEDVRAGGGNILIRDSFLGGIIRTIPVTDTNQVTFSGNQLTINPTIDLDEATTYFVDILFASVRDIAGNFFQGMTSQDYRHFTTTDPTLPVLLGVQATDWPILTGATDLLLFFDEGMKAGSGNFEIRNASDGSIVRSIAVTDTSQVGFEGTQVSIDPSSDLPEGYTYYVTFGSGVVLDMENNPFEGISAPSVFQFTVPHYVTGTTAADTLDAGPANDIINGQLGTDTLIGGPGDDTYIIGNYEGGATSLHMYGEPNEPISEGRLLSFVLDPIDLSYGVSDATGDGLIDTVGFSFFADDGYWNVYFTTAHLGTNLVPGTYSGGLSVASSQGATPIFGSFTVHAAEFEYSTIWATIPLTLSISFEQRVYTDTFPALYGVFNYKYPAAGPVTIDQIVENPGEGTDTVLSAIDYTLPDNVENLTLTGYASVNGTGNELDNTIIGNRGDNILSGGLGNDTADYTGIIGGINANLSSGIVTSDYQGTDTLIEIENLTGGSYDDTLTGDDAANILSGGAGNDSLNGGGGLDTAVFGGVRADYTATFSGQTVAIADTRFQSPDGTDNLTGIEYFKFADGTYAITDLSDTPGVTITGTSGANIVDAAQTVAGQPLPTNGHDTIFGLGGSDNLSGLGGDDFIDGGSGADTMIGGFGNDTYAVNTSMDVVTENPNEGTDTVQSSVTYTLPDFVENLTLTGTGAINGTGNSQANTIVGNSANNILTGSAGPDVLDGGLGMDRANYSNSSGVNVSLWTGLGSDGEAEGDTYIDIEDVTGSSLDDTVEGNSGVNVLAGGSGLDTVTYVSALEGVTVSLALTSAQNTISAGVDTLSGFENLTGSNFNDTLTGSSSANVIMGLDGNDTIDGGSGTDYMFGGADDDTYIVGSTGDVVTENPEEGTDTVRSTVTYILTADVENLTLTGTSGLSGTGNSLANVITGNSGNNILAGLGGADVLDGGAGTDRVNYADSAFGVNVSLMTGLGSGGDAEGDTYISIENATGTNFDDTIEGNSGNNVLAGGFLIDTVAYVSATSGVTVSLALTSAQNTVGAGTDTLSGFENLTGSNHNDTLTGSSTANVIMGLDGNDTLNGGAEGDSMFGGDGNDTYVVGSMGDVVTEYEDEGADIVQSSISYALTSNVENLTLTGTSGISGTGNELGNIITGNSGSNILSGGHGYDTLVGNGGNDQLIGGTSADSLTGGSGADRFIFTTATDFAPGPQLDTLMDFNRAQGDKIDLSGVDADSLTSPANEAFGFIGAAAFSLVAGQLRYEANGSTLTVSGDTNGDGSADFSFVLLGNTSLISSDFIL